MTISDHQIRLGFHYHVPAEQREDGIWMPGYLGVFLDSLADHCGRIVCFLHEPRAGEQQHLDYRLRSMNVSLHSLGPRLAAWKRGMFSEKHRSIISRYASSVDVLLIRGPSPLLPALASEAYHRGIPTALLLVGSYVEGVSDLPQPGWRKELIRIYSHYNQWGQDRVAVRSLTFVNSRELYERYKARITDLVETRTTTLSDRDFHQRLDTCQGNPVRLLYTGRFDRGKGLLEMVEAVSLLRAGGREVVLDLVGWDDSGTGVEAEVMSCALKHGVQEYIHNHGRKACGNELFEFYRRADVYVIASRSTEGFPRTIWEAMAHCVPVVATRVGSIPEFVGGVAEIVDPKSASAIAMGVLHVINDGEHRRRLITEGYQLACQNTLGRRAREMTDAIEGWLKNGCGVKA